MNSLINICKDRRFLGNLLLERIIQCSIDVTRHVSIGDSFVGEHHESNYIQGRGFTIHKRNHRALQGCARFGTIKFQSMPPYLKEQY